MVQLKCIPGLMAFVQVESFNSCMVQLKYDIQCLLSFFLERFNSCMVQLKSVTNIGFSV